jgi:carboxymethylenebutenolidase
MAKPVKTTMTLSEGLRDDVMRLRDDVMRLRDVLSDELKRLFGGVKATRQQLTDSATTEEPGAVFDAHVRAEFVERSVDTTMATMTDAPYVTHVPVMTGGYGRDEVRQFYATWFIGHWPADVQITPISRTLGQGRVIDEFILSFTHDVEIPALLPGIAPTGRKVTLPHVVVMGIVDGKVAYEHIYWDQASLLVQVGLLNPTKLPVVGAEQADKLRNPSLPSNELIHRATRSRRTRSKPAHPPS